VLPIRTRIALRLRGALGYLAGLAVIAAALEAGRRW
jgi:hypothetical protein